MKPFLKWAGGKRWFVAANSQVLVTPMVRLIEPFLGSGAVFFHLEPERAILSDTNGELISTYLELRDHPEELLSALRTHQERHSRAHYYSVRASVPEDAVGRAARFIYLNRTCFNALYRVNMRGEFNVPKGSKDTVLLADDDFDAWSKALAVAEIVAQDFAETLARAGEGDLVYVDPPYTVQHNNNNFVKYNERIFSWADQIRLAECLRQAAARGSRIVLSNADHPSVRELYASKEWTCTTVSRHSVLASSAEYRKLTTEIVVTNCLTDAKPRV